MEVNESRRFSAPVAGGDAASQAGKAGGFARARHDFQRRVRGSEAQVARRLSSTSHSSAGVPPVDIHRCARVTLFRMTIAVLSSGIELEYDTFGSPDDPALLLVMGFTAQMTAWTSSSAQQLADHHRFVIRFDNRDCGLSTKLDGQLVDPMAVMGAVMAGTEGALGALHVVRHGRRCDRTPRPTRRRHRPTWRAHRWVA